MLYAFELMLTGTQSLYDCIWKRNYKYLSNTDSLRTIPYCFVRVKGSFLPLTRNYKPLGMGPEVWANYDEYPYLLIPETSLDLSSIDETRPGHMYHTYSDLSRPRDKKSILNYLKTLRNLFKSELDFIDRMNDQKRDLDYKLLDISGFNSFKYQSGKLVPDLI